MTDLPFTLPDPDPSRPERPPRKCRRHTYALLAIQPGEPFDKFTLGPCVRCGKPYSATASRRGRTARKRGVSDELAVARLLGGQKVGQLGLPWDVVVPGHLRAQSKKTASWPSLNQVVAWLDAIPAGPELRAVTLADAPGHGRVRRLIVLDLHEFARWYGKGEPE